jgi:uncharacterized protein YjbI with pentapeptide repeats
MGICEDAPDEYCGHVLEPEDAGVDGEADNDWHESTCNAVCLREPKYDDLCVWHADTDEKTADELVDARLTPDDVSWETDYVKEHLSGAILGGIEFPLEFSFGGCVLVLAEFPDTGLLRAKFPEANLREAEFHRTVLRRAEFPEASLFGAKFPDAFLREAEFPEANLRRAKFSDADLRYAKFPDAHLYRTEFSKADLFRAKFPDAFLREAKFPEANLCEVNFARTVLRGANFSEANAQGTEFSEADLQGAKFRPACVRKDSPEEHGTSDPLGASLEDAQLEDGTDLRGADLSGARLYQTAFRDVRINDETTFGIDDEGLHGKACRYEYDKRTDVSTNGNVSRFRAAAWTYRRLESLFELNAMNERARNAHLRKEESHRAQSEQRIKDDSQPLNARLKSLGQYVAASFNWYVHRHGESVKRLLGVSGLMIFLCGIVYASAGVARQNPETMYRITQADLAQPGAAFVDLINGLYFSIITFSTIGYGDFYPASPVSRLLVGVESLAGALFIALFVFVLGRRVAR